MSPRFNDRDRDHRRSTRTTTTSLFRSRTGDAQQEKSDPIRTATATYWRWMMRKPDTRGLATALAGLYPAGGAIGATDANPLLLAGFAPVAAVPAYLAGRRAGGEQWGRLMGAGAAGIPAWLAIATHTGITHLPVLLGYSASAAAAWSAVTFSDVMKTKRAWLARQVEFTDLAARVGLDGAALRKQEDTRLGYTWHVDVRDVSRTASALVRSDLKERLAAELALPVTRVAVMSQPKHAGMITISVRLVDPWGTPVLHPLLDADPEIRLPLKRSITNGPVQVGLVPESGQVLLLPIFVPDEGAIHTLVVAGMGGGKTTLINCVIERLSACTDTLIWAIDLTKAKDIRRWAPVLDWHAAGPRDTPTALRMLRAGKRLIEVRAETSTTAVHRPTPTAPFVLIIIDEVSALLGRTDGIGAEARDLVGFIASKGRSEAVGLIVAGQRGTLAHLGTMDLKANAFNRVALGMAQRSEMNHVLPDHLDLGLPDMSTYGEGRKGVVLIVPDSKQWTAGRTFALHDLDVVEGLAAQRANRRVALEPRIVEAVGRPYATRHDHDPGAIVPGPRDAQGGTGLDGRSVQDGDGSGLGRPLRGSAASKRSALAADLEDDQDQDEQDAADWSTEDPETDREFQSLIAASWQATAEATKGIEALADAAAERDEGESRARWATRREAARLTDAATEVPEHVRAPVLDLLQDRGPEGATRAEIAEHLGLSVAQASHWLRVLVVHRDVVRRGATRNAVYTHPRHTPPEDDTQ